MIPNEVNFFGMLKMSGCCKQKKLIIYDNMFYKVSCYRILKWLCNATSCFYFIYSMKSWEFNVGEEKPIGKVKYLIWKAGDAFQRILYKD